MGFRCISGDRVRATFFGSRSCDFKVVDTIPERRGIDQCRHFNKDGDQESRRGESKLRSPMRISAGLVPKFKGSGR